MTEPFISAREVAELLGCSPSYINKLALLGKLPAYRLPSLSGVGERANWRFRLSEIEAWTAKQRSAKP